MICTRGSWSLPLLAVPCLAATVSAQQQQQCHVATVPSMTTNWTTTVSIPKFDPAQRVLTGVTVTLDAQVTGAAKFESLDLGPSVVSMSFQAALGVTRPDNTPLVTVAPQQAFVDSVSAFDGTPDFGGTSGVTHANILATQSLMFSSPPPASDLALFTGPAGNPGSIVLPVRALGTSSASGPGNLLVQFNQQASATVTVCYLSEPDCNHNGIPDAQDLSGGTSTDVDLDGLIDDCEGPFVSFCQGDGPANGGPDCPCGNWIPGNTAGCLNSTGLGGLLVASGVASVSNDTLVLTASQLPPTVPGFFFQGSAVVGAPGLPFGAGLKCIGTNVIRMAKIVSAPQTGTVSLPFPGDPAISQQFPIPAGAIRFYQVWYRNFGGPCGIPFNTTNAIRILWAP